VTDSRPWSAPRAHDAVHATVDLPGSKSITNRALVLAALAEGPCPISRPLLARDTGLMVAALRNLGSEIDDRGRDWVVTPRPLHGAVIDTGLSGTVMRFVPPLAALADGTVTFDGDDRARERPMWALIDALRQLGTTVDDAGRGRLPFTVRGAGTVPGGAVQIDTSASSQFVSALLLAGARFDKGIEVEHVGRDPVPSAPHIEMTVAMLQQRGVEVGHPTPTSWTVAPGTIAPATVIVEPDLSNAAPFAAAALVTGGQVTFSGWPASTTQAGDALRDLLTRMGGGVVQAADRLTVTGTGAVAGLDADLRNVTELVTVVAALATLAETPSRLTGIAHIRGHETDRMSALASEITGLGGEIEQQADGLLITPRPLHGGRWRAHGDHRMATAGAVLGLAVDDVVIDDIGVTSKTLPDFPAMWSRLVGE
jgi:3-phosphoshikimate 1-carboxyvinyltransferase